MADVNFDELDTGYEPPAPARRPSRLPMLAGAAISLGLLAAGGHWAYQNAMRSLHGIPVIKAEPGPMRIAPENPGGEVAAHQGLSVNDVAAVGVATPLPDQIALAPRPDELAVEDTPGLAPEPPAALVTPTDSPTAQPIVPAPDALPDPLFVAPAPGPAADGPSLAETAPGFAPPTSLSVEPAEPEAAPAADPVAAAQALADALANGATPLAPVVAEPAPEPVIDAPVVPGGIGKSLRPAPRPGGRTVAAAPDGVAAALALATTEIDPTTLSPGTRLVQFGAFDTADEARAHWDKLAGQFGELLTGKGRVIQSAESGGRTFYRLRAHGFSDEADARRFCSAITTEGPECIPVALR